MESLISFFGPGVRPDRWMGLWNSIAQSQLPFDLTIIGHKEPEFDLPPNFRYVYSTVKPAQCAEVGYRMSKADLICPVADDEVFIGDAVKKAYELYKSLNNEKALVSFRYILKGEDLTSDIFSANRFDVRDPNSPMYPLCPLMHRNLWKSIGGIDKRFIALYWDGDLAMRVYEAGGIGIVSKDASLEELGEHPMGGSHKLYDKYGPPYDRIVLDSFWATNGQYGKQRLSPVEPFDDKDILLVSQGPKGEWW